MATTWAPVRAGILPSRGTVRTKGESLPTGRTSRPGGRTILPSCAQTRTMLRSRRDPVANAASFASLRTNAESCVPRPALRELARARTHQPVEALSEGRSTRSHSDAAAGRSPAGAAQPQVEAQPEDRSRRSRPSRSSAAAGRSPASPEAAAARRRAERSDTARHGTTTGTHETPRPGVEGSAVVRGSPDGIRTRATALRGRRARPLHNGAPAPRSRVKEAGRACGTYSTLSYPVPDSNRRSPP